MIEELLKQIDELNVEDEIKTLIRNEVENDFENAKHDPEHQIREINEIEVFCECSRCQRQSMNPFDWGNARVFNGSVVEYECYNRLVKGAEFDQIVDDVECILKELGWSFDYSIASTGSRYYTASKCVEDEENDDETCIEVKIRVADHSECYCTEDISIDPDGYAPEQLRQLLKERETDA